MPEWSGRVQHFRWILVPIVIAHSLPLRLVQGHDQILLGCEAKRPCDPENNTSRTIRIDIDWKYLLAHRKFPYGDCFHEL